MCTEMETRFERYCETMVAASGHADRATPAKWYLRGLMLPGGRKSVGPMAARAATGGAFRPPVDASPGFNLGMARRSPAVAEQVLPVVTRSGQMPCYWLIDDTGFPKKGTHSMSVARRAAEKQARALCLCLFNNTVELCNI